MNVSFMKRCRIMQAVLFVVLFAISSKIYAEEKFGYLSYMTTNIGDDIQGIAAKRLLPSGSLYIDRELIGVFDHDAVVHTVVNGWFMHTKRKGWYRPDIAAPEKSWPPAPCIDPLLISIYICPDFAEEAFTEEGIAYFKAHAPVGARDYSTLERLRAHGIPSYFSGCMTLTLDNPYKDEREDVIYAVDVTPKTLAYIRANSTCEVVEVTHGVPAELYWENDHEKRVDYVNEVYNKYRKARCVVTQRLHAAMPCLAFETPVLFVAGADHRFAGLRELTWHCTEKQLLSGNVPYNFDKPPENPNDYLVLRKQLIQKVKQWVKEKKGTAAAK